MLNGQQSGQQHNRNNTDHTNQKNDFMPVSGDGRIETDEGEHNFFHNNRKIRE